MAMEKSTLIIDESTIVNPINPGLTDKQKLDELDRLSKENQPIVQAFLARIDKKFGTQSADNFKLRERIVEKASRPSIKRNKPWFSIEHIRDAYRFKTVLSDIAILPKIVQELKTEGFTIIKIDIRQLLEPAGLGWRIVVFDLKLPNGQLVEYYLQVEEVEAAKHSGNHDLYEKWRNKELENLSKSELDEMFDDRDLSCRRYQEAWQAYLQRTLQNEKSIKAVLDETQQILG